MHPLAPDLSNMSDDDLLKKINELMSRMRSNMNMRNPQMTQQLNMLYQDYQAEYNRRMQAQAEKFAQNNKKLADKIDIG